MYFIELERFGWNWLTVSFLCISAITTWQYFAFAGQAAKIWDSESAEAASITQNTFRCFTTAASIVYGLMSHNLVITYTGGLTIPGLFIMWGLWKFGTPVKKDQIALIVCIIGMLLFLVPINPAWVFAGFMVVGLLPLFDQVHVLLKTKVRGVLHGGMLLTFVVKNVALTVFSFAAQEKVYMIFVPYYLAVTVWQYVLWWKYGAETETKLPRNIETAD